MKRADFVFIHREAAPIGPPILEYVIAKVLKKKIIFDFDDAIWLTDKTSESIITRAIRSRSKASLICQWSYKISCGNSYLADYARKYNPRVIINPTTVHTGTHLPVTWKDTKEKITIGWTGSHSTLKYLKTLLPVFQLLERKYPETRFLIIADKDPLLHLNSALFRPWNEETEIEDLARMDVGVMPLPDDPWTRGKCGFKALQYMAIGIPAVVSPVGVNTEIVEHGVEGYWCKTHEEWFTRLEELILDPDIRREMGKKGRQKVIDHYSVSSNSDNFLSLFQ